MIYINQLDYPHIPYITRTSMEKEQYENKGAVQVGDMLTASVTFAKENGYAPYYLYRQKINVPNRLL